MYDSNILQLRKFEYKGKELSSFLDYVWKNHIKVQMLADCHDTEIDIYKLDTTYRAHFDTFKMSINHRIDENLT